MHLRYNGTGLRRGRALNGARCVPVADDSFPVLATLTPRPVKHKLGHVQFTARAHCICFVLQCCVVSVLSCCCVVLLAVVLYCYNKIEVSYNGRREINRMCKTISCYLRHESSQILGQQLQIIFVEENIGGTERRRYVEFQNFIYFVS